jgi:hypothetical protein
MQNNNFNLLMELQSLHSDIVIILTPTKSYMSSYCSRRRRTIHIGTLENNETNIITTLLHEIGHLKVKRLDVIDDEKAAWKYAKTYAKKNGIPFNHSIMRSSIAWYESYDRAFRAAVGPHIASKKKLNIMANSFLKKLTSEFVNRYKADS